MMEPIFALSSPMSREDYPPVNTQRKISENGPDVAGRRSSSRGDDPPLPRPREAGFIITGLALALVVVVVCAAGRYLIEPIKILPALESHVFELALLSRRPAKT